MATIWKEVRKVSETLETLHPYAWDFDPFERLAVIDYGDCYFDAGRPKTITTAINEHSKMIVDAGVFMMTFGGDQFISYPLIKSHADKYGPLSLVHFDAHSDMEGNGKTDSEHHGTMFLRAHKGRLINSEKLVQVGIRTKNFETYGYKIMHAPWVLKNGQKQPLRKSNVSLGITRHI